MKKPRSSQIPALVLGGGITALGTARVLGRSGIPVRCADNQEDFVPWCRWSKPLAGLTTSSMPPSKLLEFLEAALPGGAVLVPCSDPWALTVAAFCSQSPPDKFRASISSPAVIETLTDKNRLREILERLGVPHPLTVRVTRDADLEHALTRFPSGAFLKPTDSVAFLDVFGVKALHFNGVQEGVDHLRNCLDHGLEMLVQDYIPGPPTRHIFVDGFRSGRDGELRVLVRRRLRMFPPDFGNSTAMVTIAPAEAQPAIEGIRKLLEALDYRGIFSAEFKEDPRDGAFRLLEVNARAWWYVEYAAQCGLPTPLFAYEDALSRPLPAAVPYRVSVQGVYPHTDFEEWSCRPNRRLMDLVRRVGVWVTAIQPIWCWDDPVPAIVNCVRSVRRALKRRLGRLVGRAT